METNIAGYGLNETDGKTVDPLKRGICLFLQWDWYCCLLIHYSVGYIRPYWGYAVLGGAQSVVFYADEMKSLICC